MTVDFRWAIERCAEWQRKCQKEVEEVEKDLVVHKGEGENSNDNNAINTEIELEM
jgi:hypothetical protein